MSGQVSMVFTADEAKLIQSFLKAGEAMRKLEEQSERTGKKSKSWAEGMINSVAGWAAGLASVTAAYGLLRQEIEETAKSGNTLTRALQKQLAGAGQVGQIGRIGTELRGMSGVAHMGMGGRIAALEGVRGSMPSADPARLLSLTRLAARSTIITGGGADDAKSFGGILGEVAKMGYSDDEAASVALRLQGFAGKAGEQVDTAGIKQIREMMAKGMNREEALGMFAAAMESGLGTRGLAEAKGAKRRELRATAAKGGYAEQFRSAASGDYFNQQMRMAVRDEGVRASLQGMEADALAENTDYDQRIAAMATVARETRVKAEADRKGYGALGQFGVQTYAKIRGALGDEASAMGEEVAKALFDIRDNTAAAATRARASNVVAQ